MRVADLKDQQRQALRSARKAYVATLEAAKRAALQQALVAHLCAHLPPAITLALYKGVGDEIDAGGLGAHAEAQGWQLCLPRVTGQGEMDFYRWSPQSPLEKGLAGIPQPTADAPLRTPEIILMPLVGADPSGHRLGQGAGYYDRALARLHAAGARPRLVGLAWDVQILPSIASEAHDVPLDALCTPTRWIDCRPPQEGDARSQIV